MNYMLLDRVAVVVFASHAPIINIMTGMSPVMDFTTAAADLILTCKATQ